MKIYLLCDDRRMTDAWEESFRGYGDVEVVHSSIGNFLRHHEVDCIVSPGNSYGLLDGGYDLALSDIFGWGLQEAVQKRIKKDWGGEQNVGTALIVDIPGAEGKRLIHAPTMRVPSFIKDPMVVYFTMRSTLLLAAKKKVKNIVIPAFGGGCGRLRPKVIAALMKEAYDQVNNPPEEVDWSYANRVNLEDVE